YCKAVILFGLNSGGHSLTTKAINFEILNVKVLIAKRSTTNEPLHPWELKAFLPAAARYAALDLKIPTLFDNSWIRASEEIKCSPSVALSH
ncbi:Hypothetical protein FKW44_012417, partial [Caligus rogercresseyi]